MRLSRRTLLAGIAGAALASAIGSGPAAAQSWPEPGRTITAIVPFTAGGGTDAFARRITPKMSEALGVPIEVVNRPGASSQIGMTELANAAPDGYTIGFQIFPTSLAYLDPERQSAYTRDSFTPIGPAFVVESVLAVRTDSQFETLGQLVEHATANPGVLTAATPGVLSTGHLAAIGFEQATGVDFALVNFQGGGPSVTATLGGHVAVGFFAMNELLPQLESRGGQLRALAVLSDQDNPYEVPTAVSQGFDVPSYAPDVGIVAPAGIPAEAQAALSEALKAALEDPEIIAAAADTGNSIGWESPEDYTARWIEAEERYAPLIELAKQ
ncbi:tripartite tricarboxylate transporter substrate binding protein [Arsenicitalea aurantiaca]|uniref:Tripartite tricarboxylate transporter substrate binding protein n=1 Tax=Arsenicitalea aurantiaca TaxID=1783274 RepID=A0A433XLA3_9HYPH|nr:tripartite tricarboxylate transporter substrate binding protein [Arsenicitalea aurantiaca]RUT34804.1 tripartite tricarboxylate transporter substrate binding protein [Arsenicitalea aurantiaca]